jgi:alpha-tubulin suppressor-like RCC1 family protein
MCGVTTSDVGYCWGNNHDGQLGSGTAPQATPVPVPVAGNLRFRSISSGWEVACGLTTSGSVYCWGSDIIDSTHFGTLGGGDAVTYAPVPRPIAGGRAYTALSVGGFEACALADDGQVYCWGMGRLGTTDVTTSNVPTAVAGGRTFTRLLGGYSYFCAYTADDVGYCWGGGRFAPNRFDIYLTPTAVPQLPVLSSRASPMNNGDFACLVEKSSSQVYCWGNNSTGAMGDGAMTSFKTTLSKVRVP